MTLLSNIRRWLNSETPNSDGTITYESLFGEGWDSSATVVNEKTALASSAAYACIMLLTNTLATLPLHVYQRESESSKKTARNHPLYHLLHSNPNPRQTDCDMWTQFGLSLFAMGTGYLHISRDFNDRPVELNALLATWVEAKSTGRADHSVEYHVREPLAGTSGEYLEYVVQERDIVRVPGVSFDGIAGLKTIHEIARKAILINLKMQDASLAMQENAIKPSAAIEVAGKMSKDALRNLTASLRKWVTGKNAGNALLLDNGMKYVNVSANSAELQALESRRYSAVEIARYYGVPPHMIGETDRSTSWGSGIEQMNLGFLQYSMQPWIIRVECAINKKLFLGDENFFAQYSLAGLLRGDTKTRADVMSKQISSGILTPNEARALENREPLDGGDDLLVQGALVPLAKLGDAKPGQNVPNDNTSNRGQIIVISENTAGEIGQAVRDQERNREKNGNVVYL